MAIPLFTAVVEDTEVLLRAQRSKKSDKKIGGGREISP